ncbi:MAG: hypothetical protein AAF581_05500 [Planctomycetota bacterium]
MKKVVAVVAAASVVVLLFNGPALARAALESLGLRVVGIRSETYRMPGGYTVGGRVGDPRRFCDRRQHHFVPDHLGQLLEITQSGPNAVFWYEDDNGQLRNVVVCDADKQLVLLEKQPSRRLSKRRD